ncbi:MAG: hypothetical protein DWQ08_01335 [Proteobacteria bacterium]|nr:MAG: hypothetical protein DWQ08_01335 [Pseudomonadota bacterium]
MIRRLRKARGPHTVLLNDTVNLIRDPVALAIFAYLHTKPDSWEISPREICEHFGIGRYRWQKAARQLRELGLLTYQVVAGGDKGAEGSVYVLHYAPETREPNSRELDSRELDSRELENSAAEKPVPLETKELQQTKYLQETKDPKETKEVAADAKAPPTPTKSTAVWQAYRDAYRDRYGVEPIRDARTNKQLCLFVDRVGHNDAPGIASFFLTHNHQYYLQRGHDVSLLVQDAQKLRTEWLTGNRITAKGARTRDAHEEQTAVVNRVLAKMRARS